MLRRVALRRLTLQPLRLAPARLACCTCVLPSPLTLQHTHHWHLALRVPTKPPPPLPPPPAPLPSHRGLTGAVRLVARALWLGVLLLPSLLLLGPALLWPERWMRLFEEAVMSALRRGGPCLIKLGQWASTRPDVLPLSTCTVLSQLHVEAPMHDNRITTSAIATELGEAGERWLASVDPTPVGSGCIAQVHRAVGADGALLAVKVLHPGVEEVVGSDLCLLRTAAWAVEALVPLPGLRWLALREAVDEFSRFMAMQAPPCRRPSRALGLHRSLNPMASSPPSPTRTPPHHTAPHHNTPHHLQPASPRRQLDLRTEAAHLLAFRHNFEDVPASAHVHFPRPLAEQGLVSRRVLVESWAEGQPLTRLLSTGARRRDGDGGDGGGDGGGGVGGEGLSPAESKALARQGLRAFLTMLLQHNLVHADLHPGNILARLDGGGVEAGGAEGTPPFAGLDPLAVCQLAEGEKVRGGATQAEASPRPPRAGAPRASALRAPRVPQLTFVDAGLVVRLSEQDRTNFLELFQATRYRYRYKYRYKYRYRCRYKYRCTEPQMANSSRMACN